MSSNLSMKKHRAAPRSKKPYIVGMDNNPINTPGRAESAIDEGRNISPRTGAPPYAFIDIDPSLDNNNGSTIISVDEADEIADASDFQRMAREAFNLANAAYPPLPTLDESSGDLDFEDLELLTFKSSFNSTPASIAASQHGTFFSGIPTVNPFAIDPLLTGIGSQFTEPESQTQPQPLSVYRPVPHVESAALKIVTGQAEYDDLSRRKEGYFRSLLHTRSMIESGAKSNVARSLVIVQEHRYIGELFEDTANEIGAPEKKAEFEAQDPHSSHFTARLEKLLSAALAAQYSEVAGGVDANDLCLETRVWVLEKLNELTAEVYAWIKANEKNRSEQQSHMELPGHMVLENSSIKKMKTPISGNGKGNGVTKAKGKGKAKAKAKK